MRNRFGPDLPLTVVRGLSLIRDGHGISDAARALGVSQPALSKGIADLEKKHGMHFLRRGLRPLELTTEGTCLALYADKMDHLLETVARDLDDARCNRSGLVRIGSFGASASTHLLPDALGVFSRLHPSITVEIRESTDADVLDAVHEGRVDFAVITEPGGDDLDYIPIASDQLMALVPAGHDAADKDALTAGDFDGQPFVLTKGGSAPLVLDWFTAAGRKPHVAHHVLQISSIVACVRAGLGLSIIAELAVPASIPGVIARPLLPAAKRWIVFAHPRAGLRSHAADMFWNFCQSYFDQGDTS